MVMSERETRRWTGSTSVSGEILSRFDIVVREFPDAPSEPAPWLDDARRELRDLKLLSRNWDSYGALDVNEHTIERAYLLLRQLASDDAAAPKPVIAPSTEGGVRLQWDVRGSYIVIQFDPDEAPTVFYEEAQGNTWEGRLGTEPKPFIKLLWEAANF